MQGKTLLALLFVAQILLPPYDISIDYGACLFWERVCENQDAPCDRMHCEIDDFGAVLWLDKKYDEPSEGGTPP